MTRVLLLRGALALVLGTMAPAVLAREPDEPIRLAWMEGDVAGMQPILSADGTPIGFVEYYQRRRSDVLEAVRIARFSDGSSDEDRAEARVGNTLEALRGRSIIREASGTAVVDVEIDVVRDRVNGFYREDGKRHEVDLPPATYWGPLVFVVVKNFAANAEDGRVEFRTVALTPKPRVLGMELVRGRADVVRRPGGEIDVIDYALRPTIHWLVDPIVHRIAPETHFLLHSGTPPALARYAGPRNYSGQAIRLE